MPTVRSHGPLPAHPDVIDEIFSGSPMISREWLQRAGGFEPELTKPSHNLGEIASVADGLDAELAGITPAPPPPERSSP